MKRRWSISVAAALSVVVMTSAAAQETCTPVEPTKWEGTITYGGGGWVGGTTFEQGGCSWNGADALNESDVVIWEVDGYDGVTASLTQVSADGLHHPVQGFFFDDACERGGFWGPTEPDAPMTIGIPEGARWLLVYQTYGGVVTDLTLETPGRQCEVPDAPKPPKKKKKPKRP